MMPASWIFSTPIEGEAKVFEASNDLAVHTGSKMIRENTDNSENQQSVVQLLDSSKLSGSSITTSYSFKGTHEHKWGSNPKPPEFPKRID